MSIKAKDLGINGDKVCQHCQSSDWHVNLFWDNESESLLFDDDIQNCIGTWCHTCSAETELVIAEGA
jgi:hypothetical protein